MANADIDFIAYSKEQIAHAHASGNYNLAQRLKTNLNKFVAYLGKDELAFYELTPQLLRDYRTWLADSGISRSTVATYLRILKQLYDIAVSKGVITDMHPFEGIELGYNVKKEKNGLTLHELQRLRDLDLSEETLSMAFARDIFIFSVCAKGMGCNDILRLAREDIEDGSVTYTPLGTKRIVTFRWEPLMQEIVDRYAEPNQQFVFPVITDSDPAVQWRQCNSAVHIVNANLKKIGKKLGLPFTLTPTIALNTWEKITQDISIGSLLVTT